MFQWSWEPTIILGLIGQLAAYLACVGPLRHYFADSVPVPRRQIVMFVTGSIILFLSLVSPLAILSDAYLLSAHMIQHLLLMVVVVPLFLAGTPPWLFRPLTLVPVVPQVGYFLTRPLVAFIIFNSVFSAWHLPAFYDAALREPLIHAFEHALFIGTATLSWWPVLGPLPEWPRASTPLQVLYLFLQALPPTILGALITFAEVVLYPTYAQAPRVFALSPLTDQEAAGLIMWFIGGLAYLVALTVIFFGWFNDEEGERYHERAQVPR